MNNQTIIITQIYVSSAAGFSGGVSVPYRIAPVRR